LGYLPECVEEGSLLKNPPWCSLSVRIGYQTHRFCDFSRPIRGRNRSNADFFNRLDRSRNFALRGFWEVRSST